MADSHDEIGAVRRAFRLDFIDERADLTAQVSNAWAVAEELWSEDASGFELPLSCAIRGEQEDA